MAPPAGVPTLSATAALSAGSAAAPGATAARATTSTAAASTASAGTASTTGASAHTWTFRCRRLFWRSSFGSLVFCHLLKLQSAFAGSVGHTLHAAVVFVSSSIEDNALDAGILRLGGNALSNLDRSRGRLSL